MQLAAAGEWERLGLDPPTDDGPPPAREDGRFTEVPIHDFLTL
jgi:hypothetical protein